MKIWQSHRQRLPFSVGETILKNIQEDIKSGNFKPAYLLYGAEAYLKQQYKHNLVKALNPDGDTMNFTRFEGKGIEIKELIDLCETMPFLLTGE